MINEKYDKLQTQNNIESQSHQVKIQIALVNSNNINDNKANIIDNQILSPCQSDKKINSSNCNNLKDENTDLDEKAIIEQNYKYFQEYNKLYEANMILKNQLSNLTKEKNLLKHTVNKLEVSKNHKRRAYII
jgi:hypothetical protein